MKSLQDSKLGACCVADSNVHRRHFASKIITISRFQSMPAYAWQRFTHLAINCAPRKPAAAFSIHIFTLVWQPPRAVSHFNHQTDVWARVRSFIFHCGPLILAYQKGCKETHHFLRVYTHACMGKPSCSFTRHRFVPVPRRNNGTRTVILSLFVCTHNDNLAKSPSGRRY